MNNTFDSAAEEYDDDFTYSQIGIYQRNSVWEYIGEAIGNRKLEILELNAGTGEDALWFAQKGHKLLVTDLSDRMLSLAESKIKKAGFKDLVSFQKLDLSNGLDIYSEQKFDLVFSNFAGLNCLKAKDLKKVFKDAYSLLKPGGELIFVFLGKFCFWETAYFASKGNLNKAFRRNTDDPVIANVSGEEVKTWYYSPDDIREIADENFQKVGLKSIGTFVPPSYLNKRFKRDSGVLKFFNSLDESIGGEALFSKLSDHYLIHFKKQ
ncbi:MAG: class I SAM-dependent methyltransferase [Salibacteraceae bacterium]